jgi:hypothetical protein
LRERDAAQQQERQSGGKFREEPHSFQLYLARMDLMVSVKMALSRKVAPMNGATATE